MTNRIIVDSSFLYALAPPNDMNHQVAVSLAQQIATESLVIPVVALTEVTFLIRTRIGYRAVTQFLKSLSYSDAVFESLTLGDLSKISDITQKYRDARLDFVDCCIMALSERLQITQVATFDRRDFAIFRPSHTDFLTLLP